MNTTTSNITIGLDLGDKRHAVCVLDAAGKIISEHSITNHRESLKRQSFLKINVHLRSFAVDFSF